MRVVPIVFAFDNNLLLPACVCISSLMINAKEDTYYDIIILHSQSEILNKEELNKIQQFYLNCRIQYRTVGSCFDSALEIRGITTPTYYRLLIPDLIPEYDKVIYSDVDVIFRSDLSDIYFNTNLDGYYVAGVNALVSSIPDLLKYYKNIKSINPKNVIYAGNLIINTKELRENKIVPIFKQLVKENFKFQDLDVLNIACADKIKQLPPSFCLTTYFFRLKILNESVLENVWQKNEIEEALTNGIVHFNGPKPWKEYCVYSDIWWEYFRKCPFYDEFYYYKFYEYKMNELDLLPLWKRIKILFRYFVYGRKK